MAAKDTVTLDQLVQAIMSDESIAAGTNAAPGAASRAECQIVLEDLYTAHTEIDHSLVVVAKKMGRRIACEDGCSGCCESLVLISGPEADALVDSVRLSQDAALRERVVAGASRWRERAGTRALRASARLRAGRNAEYLDLMREHAQERIMCPLNEGGRCAVYRVRPLPCRQAWVLDTAEHCVPPWKTHTPKAERVTHAAYEEFLAMARRVSAGLQSAMGQGVDRQPMPLAILERLEAEPDSQSSQLADDLSQ